MDGRIETEDYQGTGRVSSVDIKAGKVRLTHGPIPELGWQATTMTFSVADKSLLENLRPGEKVSFTLSRAGQGRYAISEIRPLK